jgi:hypothetical protein
MEKPSPHHHQSRHPALLARGVEPVLGRIARVDDEVHFPLAKRPQLVGRLDGAKVDAVG